MDVVGAYGLRMEGASAVVRAQLGRADPDWPRVEIRGGVSDADDELAFVRARDARVGLPGGGEIVVTRDPLAADVRPPTPPGDDELLHPYLGYVAAIAARWLGRDCVHAGAFVVDGRAWALVGGREAGKSSLLAWLAANGHEIVCDDVLVTAGDWVYAGPRFVDLRAEPSERVGQARPIGRVGARHRWRLPLATVPARVPLAGWVFLGWGESTSIERASVARRLATIKAQLSLFTTPRDAASLLDLAAFPGWELRRPPHWDSMPHVADRLLETLAG